MGRRRARGGQGSREEQEEGIGPGVALIGGVSAPTTGLHTGIIYQGAGEASSVGNYSEVLRAALADQLMLAHTDLIVAASNGAVSSLSAFARAAGTRAAKRGSLVHLKLHDRDDAGACQPSPWPWDGYG